MTAIRLSICIATLNRAAFIGGTLESIISQATDEVEIIVVDGASTDNTEEVVRRYIPQCPGLRYTRLEQKGGVDKDYCKTIELARGDYCWLFTDDDLLKPGAIAAVLAATRRDYSLIVVNAEVRTSDLSVCLQSKRIKASKDQEYEPTVPAGNQLLGDVGEYLSFIGGVVIKREIWTQREKEKFFGTEFVHMGVIFQGVLPGLTLVMSNPWIIIRYGNAQWASRHFNIWMFKWPNIVWSFQDFSDKAKKRVVAREPWRSWERLLLDRATAHYSLKEYTQWLKPLYKSQLEKMIGYAIAVAPVAPLNLLARFCLRLILRKAPCITLFDLEKSLNPLFQSAGLARKNRWG